MTAPQIALRTPQGAPPLVPDFHRVGRGRFLRAFAQGRTFPVLGGWLVIVVLLGGGARDDVQSLMILRPLSLLVLGYAFLGLTREQAATHRFLLGLVAAWAALPLLQLVPLPAAWWQSLPGRGLIIEIDRAAGLGDVTRPLTMAPHATWNALWALAAPAAVLLLGIGIGWRDRSKLLTLVLALGLVSAVIGGLQLAAPVQSDLFFYRITNPGSPVGLFANRNHQAMFLAAMPPMLLVWAVLRSGLQRPHRRADWLCWAGAAGGLLLVVPLILVIGSRAGLMLCLFGLCTAPALLSGLPQQAGETQPALPHRGRTIAMIFLGIGGLLLLTALLGRGLALDRLIASDGSDMRFRVLGTLRAMIDLYLPWGTGLGSFAEVYQVHEPQRLLAPVYLNHAHNDWLELALTGGVPAIVLAGVAVAGFLVRARQVIRPHPTADRREILLGRLGLLLLLMFAAASLGDYPLRTPALACLAAIATLWAAPGLPRAIRHP